ncbi:MAG: PspA/IM30 family protein [Mariprofundales bacterium]
MSIWAKIITAMRGAANEAGEAVVDNQALRILDQEMRDAQDELRKAKQSLTEVMAEKMAVDRKVNELSKATQEHESYATQALNKGDEALALEIAEKMAEFANDLEAQKELQAGYASNIKQLKRSITETARNIKTMQREISVVKTTEAVQKANEAASARFADSNSSMRSATDSLQRIKERQQKRSDRFKAAQELDKTSSGTDLKDKMKAAGIIEGNASANSILANLRAKTS